LIGQPKVTQSLIYSKSHQQNKLKTWASVTGGGGVFTHGTDIVGRG